MNLILPEPLERQLRGQSVHPESIGKSGAAVLRFADSVLKIETAEPEFQGRIEMLRWLQGRIPVPRVLWAGQEAGWQYLHMSAVPGKMACDGAFLDDPEALAEGLARAIRMLWAVDISDCPRHRRLEDDLLEAEQRIAGGLIDLEDCEPETFGPGGFKNPEALLLWLQENQPPLDPVLSHGDLCLPNVFFADGQVSGFIDLGDAGVSDRWRDIALCHRSLGHNLSGKYAARRRAGDPDRLFSALGIVPDREKLRYYVLLDELF